LGFLLNSFEKINVWLKFDKTGTSSAYVFDHVSLDSAWVEKSFRGNEYAHSMSDTFFFFPENRTVCEIIERNNTIAVRAKEGCVRVDLLWGDIIIQW
jgi:hypothetical protein